MPSAAAAKANMKGSKAQAKKTAKVVVNQPPLEEENDISSDSGSGSDIGSDSDGESTGASNSDNQAVSADSDSDSDPDSLLQDGPRKRRRASPETTGGDKTKRRLISSGVTVPSRIRRVEMPTPTQTSTSAPPPESIAGPTAPADADTTFATLGVVPWLGQSLASLAIKRPTAIQKATIPEILKGRDCIGGSRTGSGKTVAFAVPMIQRWAENPTAIFGLILTPTRELALQIYEQIKAIASPHYLKAGLIIGGADMRTQAIELGKSPHIIIATPGRLADHIRTSGSDTYAGLRRIRFVILDEADRLLADGPGSMRPDIEECLAVLPPLSERQTLLFTATMTPEIRALKDEPRPAGRPPFFFYEVNATGLAIPPTLAQSYLKIPVTHREHFLHTFLLTPANADKSVIIFCNRTATADLLHHLLRALDHRVTSLHSRLPQRQRIDNLGRFRASAARILIATDVAARGLDIPEVKLVVNYDIPRDPDDYIHRVGRTARAGRRGEAVTFVGQRDVDLFLAIEARVGAKMDEWSEEGVNLETRVLRDALKVVSEKKREALLELEEGREVGGKRNRNKVKLRAT